MFPLSHQLGQVGVSSLIRLILVDLQSSLQLLHHLQSLLSAQSLVVSGFMKFLNDVKPRFCHLLLEKPSYELLLPLLNFNDQLILLRKYLRQGIGPLFHFEVEQFSNLFQWH